MGGRSYVAQRVGLVDASGIRKVFDLAAGMKNPIDLAIGQPDYPVPEPVKDAAIQAIRDDFSGYTVTQGIPELREKLTAQLKSEFNLEPSLLVTSGVSGALSLLLTATVNPGDEIIFVDPYFVLYKHLINLCCGKPVMVSSYPDFRLPIEKIEAAITPKTKAILINSPNNPTGTMISDQECRSLAELAEKHDLLIITDEIYEKLSYDGPCPSIVPYAPDRTVMLRGFSKTYAMTGWRLAYATGPADIIREMTKLQQYSFVCAPSMVQKAGVVALDVDVTGHVDDYRRKRDLVYNGLKDHFDIVKPTGGFYIFPKAPARFASGTAFVEEAIANQVLIIPGGVFSERDTHFRISYAVPDDRIRAGCEALCKIAAG